MRIKKKNLCNAAQCNGIANKGKAIENYTAFLFCFPIQKTRFQSEYGERTTESRQLESDAIQLYSKSTPKTVSDGVSASPLHFNIYSSLR